MKELKKYNVANLEVDDTLVEFYLTIDFFGRKDVCLNFEEYDVSVESERNSVLSLTNYALSEIPKLSETIFNEIQKYAKKEYGKNITQKHFKEGDITVTTIYFFRHWTKGTFCMGLNSFFEEEHAVGIVFHNEEIKKIGYADICFDSSL